MRTTLISVLVLAILVGCKTKPNSAKGAVEKRTFVTTVSVKKEKVITTLRYSGTIEAVQTIPLTFQTSGVVEKVMVEPGDEVKKGQLLATLDESDARNIYQITLVKFEQAQDAYNRLKSVHDKGSLTEIKWIEMETNLEQAKSSKEISKNNLEKCKLYAPASGIIGRRNIEPGMSSLTIGKAPLDLVDIKQVYVKISIPENEIAKITKGLKTHFSVSALREKAFEGEISNISPVADLISRTYEAKIKVGNPGAELKPGMVCDVAIDQSTEKEMVLIPGRSVSVDHENNHYVYLVDLTQNRVKKQTIRTGEYQGDYVEVISGLIQGQLIVKEGKEKLIDNSLITL